MESVCKMSWFITWSVHHRNEQTFSSSLFFLPIHPVAFVRYTIYPSWNDIIVIIIHTLALNVLSVNRFKWSPIASSHSHKTVRNIQKLLVSKCWLADCRMVSWNERFLFLLCSHNDCHAKDQRTVCYRSPFVSRPVEIVTPSLDDCTCVSTFGTYSIHTLGGHGCKWLNADFSMQKATTISTGLLD